MTMIQVLLINGTPTDDAKEDLEEEQYYTLQKILTLIQKIQIETLGPEQKSKAIEDINHIISRATELKNKLEVRN